MIRFLFDMGIRVAAVVAVTSAATLISLFVWSALGCPDAYAVSPYIVGGYVGGSLSTWFAYERGE